MEQEEILRQEAIRLHLQGVSVKLISEQVNRTRQWVYKWLNEFKEGSSDWYKTKSAVPKISEGRLSFLLFQHYRYRESLCRCLSYYQ